MAFVPFSWLGFAPRKLNSHPKPLGRRVPTTDLHIVKHRLSIPTVTTVEHTMHLPLWHWTHDQGEEGACVGHGSQMERAIRELFERRRRGTRPYTVRFDPWWLWDWAKANDEYSDTAPGDDNGTSVAAGYDVLRRGNVRSSVLWSEPTYPGTQVTMNTQPSGSEGVQENQWATSVDEIRSCIARDQPVTIGINWYSNFDDPESTRSGYFIGRGRLGYVRGGHCVCIYGASDRRAAFRVKNSWGRAYPLVWLTYEAMDQLLSEQGEATLVVDKD